MVGWQIENETTNRPYPPDVTLSEINACSFLADKIDLKQPIVTPGFARPLADELGGYTEAGLAELCDVFALHVYLPPEKMCDSVATARQVLAKTSKPACRCGLRKPVMPWSAGNVKNPTFRGVDGRKRALPTDDMESAVSLVRSAWIARACGVAKFIPLRLPLLPGVFRQFRIAGSGWLTAAQFCRLRVRSSMSFRKTLYRRACRAAAELGKCDGLCKW